MPSLPARRALLVAVAAAVLVALVGAATSGATSEPPRPYAIVRGINLTPDDLPGWEHEPPPAGHDRPAKAAPGCPGSRLRKAQATGLSDVFSDDTPVFIHSQVWVVATARQAADEVAAVRTTHSRHCLAREMRRAFAHTLRVTHVSVRPLKVHPPSTVGLRMRMGYDYRGRHGISVVDHRWFSFGRAIVILESSTGPMPYAAAKMDALQGVLYGRAQDLLPGG